MKIINEEYNNKKDNSDYNPLVPSPENIYFYRGAWE